jgi:hypothetical protein
MPLLTGVLLQMKDRLAHRRVQPVAAGVDIGEDRLAHARVPEFLDVIGDAAHDLVLLLRLEELADLVAMYTRRPGDMVYSAATSVWAMRRDCRVSSSYSSCHSVGPLEGMTCTAVTLYSGQLVARSENSVVTTLAWVSG